MLISPFIAFTLISQSPVIDSPKPSVKIEIPKIVAASMFKNGYAVMTRAIPLSAGESTLEIEQLPNAVYGTIWFSSTSEVQIQSVTSTTVDISHSGIAQNMGQILAANIGNELILEITDDSANHLSPTVVTAKILNIAGDSVIYESAEGKSVIPISRIQKITGQKKLNTDLPATIEKKSIFKIKTSGTGKGILYISDLESGLTWSPSYFVDITDPKKLNMIAKATISDDLGPLKNLEVHLVTGFPNVRFISMQDPLLIPELGSRDASFNASMNGMLMNQASAGVGGGGMYAKRVQSDAIAMPEGAPSGMEIGTLGGTQNEDLYFYRQANVTLEKGEKGYYPILKHSFDYKEIYTWDLHDPVTNNVNYGVGNRPDPGIDAGSQVWHSLTFTNTSGQPLTTGSAQTFKKGEMLGQDMMTYTSKGAETTVRITEALDVTPDIKEEETAREVHALNGNNYPHYDLVTVKATLQVTNRKDKAIQMRITRPYSGTIIDPAGGSVTKNTHGLRDVNGTGTIVWEPSIDAGKGKTIVFTYKLYVQSPN